jgi:hypothetical protein
MIYLCCVSLKQAHSFVVRRYTVLASVAESKICHKSISSRLFNFPVTCLIRFSCSRHLVTLLLSHIVLVCGRPRNTYKGKYWAIMHENFHIRPDVTDFFKVNSSWFVWVRNFSPNVWLNGQHCCFLFRRDVSLFLASRPAVPNDVTDVMIYAVPLHKCLDSALK